MDSNFDTLTHINNITYMKSKLIDIIIESFTLTGKPPKTTLDFYKFIRMIGKGAFGIKIFILNCFNFRLINSRNFIIIIVWIRESPLSNWNFDREKSSH